MEAHTWPVPAPGAAGDAGRPVSRPCNPHALCWKPPQRVRAVGGGPVGDHPAPAPPGAPRADRALTPTGPCGAPTSANWNRSWRLPRRRIPSGALAAPPCPTSPASPPTPPRPIPFLSATTSITCRTHFIDESRERSVPQSLGCLPTPSAATASRTPVIPASRARAMPATPALIAWLALPPIASLRHPQPAPPPPQSAWLVASHQPPPPRPNPEQPTTTSTRRALPQSRTTSHHPRFPAPATPRLAPPPAATSITCRTHFHHEPMEGPSPQSLACLTMLTAAAPTDMAVGREVAKDASNVAGHTLPVPRARRGRRRLEARVETPRPLRAGRAGTPTRPYGAPTSANRTRTWRLPHRRIPPRALAAPPGRAPRASPPTPPRPIPFLGNHLNHLSYSLHRRISGTVSAPIARLPAAPQRRHRVAHPVIPASRARNASNARTDCMAGIDIMASLRHPRPAPHRPDPCGSSRAASHHPLAPTLTPRVPALPSFRSPQPC